MDKNTVIGLVLIFLLFIGFSIWNAPTEEQKEAQQRQRDSLELVRKEKVIADSAVVKQQQAEQVVVDTVVNSQQVASQFGSFSHSAQGEEKIIIVENNFVKFSFSNLGGKIYSVEMKDLKTFDNRPLVLFDGKNTNFGISFFSNNLLIETNKMFFDVLINNESVTKEKYALADKDSLLIQFRLHPNLTDSLIDESKYIEMAYVVYADEYMSKYSLAVVNMNGVIQNNTSSFELTWNTKINRVEKSYDNELNNTTVYWKDSEEVDYISETKFQKQEFTTGLKWVSFKQHFFSSTLIADSYFESGEVETKQILDNKDLLKEMNAVLILPIASLDNSRFDMQWYFGPNKYTLLSSFGMDLERQIPLGWSFFLMSWINRYAVIPVFTWLENYGLNYGIIILILTFLLKLVLFPIAYKTYLSSAKMRLLKPEIDELSKKFPKSEDAMKKQQAVMALQKKAGVNPMAGCIPMLLQLPILLALFRFFPASYELRQKAFLWADDLSSYDSIFDLPFEIPFYGDHVSLFTILMTAATLLYTKMNNDMMSVGGQNMKAMKIMMYMMPIMFLGIFNNFASGLSYYYFLVNCITFLQMFIFRYIVNEDKLRKQIESNKLKPVKKSTWAKKLEDLQRMQQQQQRNKK